MQSFPEKNRNDVIHHLKIHPYPQTQLGGNKSESITQFPGQGPTVPGKDHFNSMINKNTLINFFLALSDMSRECTDPVSDRT
jgi:hypothetical protein